MVESPDITWIAPLSLDAKLLATAELEDTKDRASCLQLSQLALLAFLRQQHHPRANTAWCTS